MITRILPYVFWRDVIDMTVDTTTIAWSNQNQPRWRAWPLCEAALYSTSISLESRFYGSVIPALLLDSKRGGSGTGKIYIVSI